jgi:aryl-alcohol dehydrogenase-like predicted oxidoreductase
MATNCINKIVLGTAQFGLSYGISNNFGKIDQGMAKDILCYSKNKGVEYLDTAHLYGNSEEIIGKSVSPGYWKIITKTPVFSDKRIEDIHANHLRSSLNDSLNVMNQEFIEGLMIHNCEDLLKPGGWKLYEEMNNLKSYGFIRKIGVSVYSSDQIRRILDRYEIDIVQLPISIFDQRLINDGCLELLKSKGVEIYARSVFLQGLLLMDYKNIPIYFEPINKVIRDFDRLSNSIKADKIALAISFVTSLKEIDHVVIGVDNITHIKQVIEIVESMDSICMEDYKHLSVSNPSFVNPSNWIL